MDPAKLKVVELRAELAARGLDTKGNKAVLYERLVEALNNNQGGQKNEDTHPESELLAPENLSAPSSTVIQEPTVVTTETAPEDLEHSESELLHENDLLTESDLLSDSELDPPVQEVQTIEEKKEIIPITETNTEPTIGSSNSVVVNKDEDKVLDIIPDSQIVEPEKKIIDESSDLNEEDNVNSNQDEVKIDNDIKSDTAENSDDKSNVILKAGNESETKTEESSQNVQSSNNKRKRSESPLKEPLPKKRQRLPPPNIDDFVSEESEPDINNDTIKLSWYDSDLNLKINTDTFLDANSLSETGLALVWAGVRSNYGIKNIGKYFYEVQLKSKNTHINYPNERHLHEFRCGWSTLDTGMQLGESPKSFGLDNSGKKCTNSEFTDYSKQIAIGDVIGVHLDISDTNCTITYTVNGKDYGTAFEFDKSELNDEAIFPHISTKNIEFVVNFGQLEKTLWSHKRELLEIENIKKLNSAKELEDKKKESEKELMEVDENITDITKSKDETTPLDPETDDSKVKSEEGNEKDEKTTPEVKDEAEKENKNGMDVDIKEEDKNKPVEQTEDNSKPTEETEKTEDNSKSVEESIQSEDITENNVTIDNPANIDNVIEIPETNCLDGYKFISEYSIDELVLGPQRPLSRSDCEVIMLIGLPGSGKSHWVLEHIKKYPEKCYTVLGTKFLLEKMKIQGVSRKPCSNHGRWEKLIEMCNRMLLKLNEIASQRRRNYILDQPHVYSSDQRRKMRVFGGFKRIAVIVVPSEEEYKIRFEKRIKNEGRDIPETAVNEMRANLSLPELEYQWFNEIIYTDLDKVEAAVEISKENERGRKMSLQRNNRNDYRSRRGPDHHHRDGQHNSGRWNTNNDRSRNRDPNKGFRRNDRVEPNNQQNVRKDFGYRGGKDRKRSWEPETWNNNRSRGGYGGAPPPRPGRKHNNRDNRSRNVYNNRANDRPSYNQDRSYFKNSPSNNRSYNTSDGNRRHNDRNRSKFGSSSSRSTTGTDNQWNNNSSWNSYTANPAWNSTNNQWNQQYNSSSSQNSSNQQWMTYFQQQQQQQQQQPSATNSNQWSQSAQSNWYNDQGYGGAFSSQAYDNTSKQ